MRRAASRGRPGHRPRPSSDQARAGVAAGRAAAAGSVFAQAGASDIDGYQRGRAGRAHLARLVLVIDEFASLAEELPDFLGGLLGIAQRGRSLGVHLVLATQRPAGVLSADIKANVGLRIALRVTDAAESVDVIGVSQPVGSAGPNRAVRLLGKPTVNCWSSKPLAPRARLFHRTRLPLPHSTNGISRSRLLRIRGASPNWRL